MNTIKLIPLFDSRGALPGNNDIVIGSFDSVSFVDVQIWWENFDTADATIQLIEKNHADVPRWLMTPTLNHTISTTSGSIKLVRTIFQGGILGLRFLRGTSTRGILNAFVICGDSGINSDAYCQISTDEVKIWPNGNSVQYPRLHPTGGLIWVPVTGYTVNMVPAMRSLVYQIVAECWNNNGTQTYDILTRTVNSFTIMPTEAAWFMFHLIEF